MASVGHTQERTSVPRIVLPITSRGLVVTDRLCWIVLAAAMAAAAGLILYLNRGTIFFLDELVHVYNSPRLDARYVLEPVNGHLAITPKLVYKVVLETIGANYVVFRVLAVLAELVCAGLFYALVKRRVGALPALGPTLVLLFFGSAWSHVVIPVGMGIFICIAAGLGALLALERGDRRGDLAACGLVIVSVATFTIGLAFLVGVAISVLRPDRWRRAWVFLAPLLLYAAWYVWSLDVASSAEGQTALSNVLLIPSYVAESIAVVAAALAGLNYDFDADPYTGDIGWGRVLAVVAVVALAMRIRRGNIPASLWVSLGIALTYWSIGALAVEPGFRGPTSTRYLYPGAIVVLLVATDAGRSIRFSKLGLLAVLGVCAISLSTNLALLRDGGSNFRSYSAITGAQFAALELARDRVDPGFDPLIEVPDASTVGSLAGIYLQSVDRYGSVAPSPAELERQTESVREGADQILAAALDLRLRASPGGQAGDCESFRGGGGGSPIVFELPPGGASLRLDGGTPAPVTLGRFATAPSAEVGTLSSDEPATLSVPTDASPRPWRASVATAASLEVCGLP